MTNDTVETTDVAHAHRLLDEAEARLRRWDTPLEAALLAVVDRRMTGEVPTMAVRLRGDGIATLLVNPDFVRNAGAEGAAFVLCHEALHLLFAHLHHDGPRDDAWQLACEVVINHWVTLSTGRPLPRSAATGTTVGVDPRAVYAEYAAAVTNPVPYAAFVRTDEDCAAHLRLMAADARPAAGACDHHLTDHDDAGDGRGSVVEEVLERAVARALDGDELVRGRLLDLERLTPGADAWRRLGVSELRGTTTRLSTRLWQTQLAHVLGQTLRPDVVVRYDRKTGWWDTDLLASVGIVMDPDVGMPLQLAPATSRHRQVAIYLDTSGSVPDEVVAAAAATVGTIPDTDVHWRSFDHEVHPFEPGDPLIGGGGTDFEPVAADVAALDDELADPLDAVVVLTDGWGTPIRPPHPQRWIWLIAADGDAWSRDRGMRTVTVTDLAGA
jgi:hypothetical protein